MPASPLSDRELDAYREDADRFVAALDEEYYLHFAGHKQTLDLEPIYERHSALTTLEQAQSVGLSVEHGGRRVRELWRFSCEGYLGNLTRSQAEKAAELEAELTAEVDAQTVPYRMLRPLMANTDDRATREQIDRIRCDLGAEHLNPVYREALEVEQEGVRALGSDTYLDLYHRFGMDLESLAAQCRDFLSSTESLYETHADKLLRARIGLSLDEAKRWDTARMMRAPGWDSAFPGDKMLPALEGTLADLGVDLHGQENVHLDVEQREHKSPRAFCSPIEVPGKVMLVIQPIGGPDDWSALFHEAGHTEHFAHTSADLPMEWRRLGDNAVTEGYAMLLQHLVDEPAWLRRRLDFPRPAEYAAEGAAVLLFFVRRYCAKLLYELEFHASPDPTALSGRYVEILGDALKIEPSPTDFLADIDPGFYVSSYLRSWALEAQLRRYLRTKFGNEWFASRDAGSLLRELWGEGQRWTAEELLREVTGEELVLESVAERIREHLALA
jgi:hypothetical protein